MQLIINAGGAGTRLWPLSTSSNPKQFAKIIDEETFIEKTISRLKSLDMGDNIWISTNVKYSDLLQKILPNFPKDKIIIEPEKRDTFAAICSNAAVVAGHVGNLETIVNIQSDAYIRESDTEKYILGLKLIDQKIQSKEYKFMSVGVKPSFPNTGLGYVEIDEKFNDTIYHNAAPVKRFTEKPNLEDATKFAESGNYFWHWGTHSFTYQSLIEVVQLNSPVSIKPLNEIYQSKTILAATYSEIPKTAFEYLVTEKIESMGIIALDVAWDDIGTWKTVYNYLPSFIPDTNHIEIAGIGNKVKTSRPELKVAFVGVSNLILIDTPDGILIMNPDHHNEIKQVSNYFDKN
jgi:mannose-1-phosphate guanylyltransferase